MLKNRVKLLLLTYPLGILNPILKGKLDFRFFSSPGTAEKNGMTLSENYLQKKDTGNHESFSHNNRVSTFR